MEYLQVFLSKADAPLIADVDYPLALVESNIFELVRRVLGKKPSAITLAKLGTYHHVYSIDFEGQGFFLKVPKIHAAGKTLLLENAIYTGHIGKIDTGIRVIQYDHSLRDFPFPFLLMTKAGGVCLRTLDIDRADFKKFIDAFCANMALIHQQRCPGSGWGLLNADVFVKTGGCEGTFDSWGQYLHSHLQEHLDFARDVDVISSEQLRIIEKHMMSLEQEGKDAKPVLLHGDLGAHNIFVDEKFYTIKAIIDWEDVLLGDPLFDVAMFASFFRMEEFTEEIVRNYCRSAGLAFEGPWRRFWLYYLRITLAKAVLLYRHGYDKGKGTSTMIPKIKLALAELKSA